jgi:hypothetical protein
VDPCANREYEAHHHEVQSSWVIIECAPLSDNNDITYRLTRSCNEFSHT